MPLKHHHQPLPSQELKILTHLNHRMDLPANDKRDFLNLNKGYEGEKEFCKLSDKELKSECISLYGLLLESNQTEFQIDNLLIFQNTIILNEVKNFEGDFFVKDADKWYTVATKKEIRNPLLQLQRSEYLLRQLLQEIGVHFQIEGFLIFVNPEFTLYQAPYNQSLIFPTQLNRYMEQLNMRAAAITSRHTELAEMLVSRHLTKSSRERLPKYHYDQLEKGIVCTKCSGFLGSFTQIKLQCTTCHKEETIESAIMRSVAEFHVLFPERRITVSKIYTWCGGAVPKWTVRRVLIKNTTLIRNGKYSFYHLKHK